MWHRTRAGALHAALRCIERREDPDLLLKAAADAGIKLPIRMENISSPSLGGNVQTSYRVEPWDYPELRRMVDELVKAKAA